MVVDLLLVPLSLRLLRGERRNTEVTTERIRNQLSIVRILRHMSAAFEFELGTVDLWSVDRL
jgi:hypothetical protein